MIRVDDKRFRKDLNDLQKKQYPFAMAKTLTDLAKAGQERVRSVARQKFELHTEFIPREVRITGAKKNNLVSEVRTTERIAFMTLQDKGGRKKPLGRALTLPTQDLIDAGGKTKTGKIKSSLQPKKVLRLRKRGQGGPGQAFSAKGMILRRKDARRYPLEILYIYEPRADIKPRWKFAENVEHEVSRLAERFFKRNMEMAINTRKE